MDNDFRYLLIALLVFLLGVPLGFDLQILPYGIVRAVGFSALLAIGVWSLRKSGRIFLVAKMLVVVSIGLNIYEVFIGDSIFILESLLLLLAFLSLATFAAMKQIATGNNMSMHRIVGAICVYLLLGVIWSLLYLLLELALPGSFSNLAGEGGPAWNPDWVYYSFVTLTSLGYGDILPLTYSARALSYLETIAGQFYLAIMVAGLVSAYLSSRQAASGSN